MRKKCEVEVFARVTGFFRPIQDWNPGKQAEARDRKKYDQRKVKREVQETEAR